MNTATFSNVAELAEFCAVLTREGIRFSVLYSSSASHTGHDYIVTIGGF